VALVLVAALICCSDVDDDELSADAVCDNQPESPFLTVEAVIDERGAGLEWNDVTMGRFQDQTFRLHTRPAGSDDDWEQAGDVVLTPVRSLTVLLPERPDPQMLAYAHRYGIDVVHRMSDRRFRRDAAPATARAAILGLISRGPVHPALQRENPLVQATFPQRPSAEPSVTASVTSREAARKRGTALER
jgi:hypothetical protein